MEEADQVASLVSIYVCQLADSWHTHLGEALRGYQELVNGHGGIADYDFAREQV